METEEDNVLHDTPARALTFIDRLPLEDGCEGYVITITGLLIITRRTIFNHLLPVQSVFA